MREFFALSLLVQCNAPCASRFDIASGGKILSGPLPLPMAEISIAAKSAALTGYALQREISTQLTMRSSGGLLC